jgi:amino acid transporter
MDNMGKVRTEATLKREISLWLLIFYGLGNILGAGIYVLIGEMVKISGYYTPLAFGVACIVVLFTALSYAELSSRYPFSAGEALYVKEGLGSDGLSIFVGLTIAMSGILSSATIISGFYDYFVLFFNLPKMGVVFGVLLILTLVASWGIKESVRTAALFTLVEMFGLILIIYVGMKYDGATLTWEKLLPPPELSAINSVFMAAFLAFYAFIGFEDMVNIAQEVKDPAKTMFKAIVWVLIISTLLYMGVAYVTIKVIPVEQMGDAGATLAHVYETATGQKATILSLIGMVAVINGALIQIIMVSRILYGMADKGWLPRFLAHIYTKTHTPISATVLTSLAILLFVLAFPLVRLAESTSFLIFIVFTLVNLSLVRIKIKNPRPSGVWRVPLWVPIVAIVLNLIMLGVQIVNF